MVDEPTDLPEGTAVEIAVLEDEDLSSEERKELEAAIDEGLDAVDRGQGSPAEEVLRRLRAT